MIVDDVEMTAIAHQDHIDFLVTQGLDTILVPLTLKQYIELQNMLYAQYSIVNDRDQHGA